MIVASRRIAKAIVILCLVWLITFPLLGGGAWGKDKLASLASKSFLHDKKAGVPILMLTLPILIAGTVASLFAASSTTTSSRYQLKQPRLCDSINICSSFRKRLPDQQSIFLVLIIFLPCLVYVLSLMRRKLSLDMSVDMALMKSGNIFGMLAVVVFSWLLVPVSRRGPIARLFAWDSIKVVNYHMWGGRIIILASVIHGTEHTIRFALQGRDVLKSYYFPPIQCWKHPQTYEPEICDKADSDEGCSCYEHFLPLTGLVAVLGLVLIGLSSLYKRRRNNFATFAMLHYILTPLTFIAICIHYNKAILYASGSLLYYLASNFPYWIESLAQRQPCGRQSNVKVVAIKRLKSDDSKNNNLQRPCIALTIEASEAAVQRCCPGAYVKLLVPSLSKVAHPFTVNRVMGQAQQIQVIFRVTGPFTRALENALFCRSTTTAPLIAGHDDEEDEESSEELENKDLCTEYHPSITVPRLYLDGYYGSGRLFSQISSHDVCVLVAAGIGITPYLSLLSEFVPSRNSKAYNNGASDGLIVQEELFSASRQPKNIILHWICRDRSLIEYCQKEYMDYSSNDLQQIEREGENCSIKIIIHQTGGESTTVLESATTTTATTNERIIARTDLESSHQYGGVPFELSNFSVGESIYSNLRYFVVFSVLSWGGLWCLWRWFNKQEGDEYIGRIFTLFAIALYGLMVAVFANICWFLYTRRTHINAWSPAAFNAEGNNKYLEKSNDVELSNYKDAKDNISTSSTVPIVPAEDPQQLIPAVTFEMLQGRPSVADILEDLDDGISPALFCCVPENLAKNLCKGVNQKSRSDGSRLNNIPMYQESFEI